jgi:hypothetical protein
MFDTLSYSTVLSSSGCLSNQNRKMAEREGFEPFFPDEAKPLEDPDLI